MGLFSNKDKPCPICGNATPRLLAKKFSGEAICSSCADNIMADDEMVEQWSMDDLKKHMQYRDENRRLFDNFTPTRTVEYEHEVVIDDNNGLFYINYIGAENPPVFRFDQITGFEVQLGDQTIESWTRGRARIPYQPRTMGLAEGLNMLAEAFGGKKSKSNKDDDDDKFEELSLILLIDTPYLHAFELCELSISGSGAAEFEHNLAQEFSKVDIVCNLIVSIAGGGVAGAVGTSSLAAPATPSAEQVADGIKKFKDLLDAGLITQEEFDAKKKQLLGI